MSYGLDQDLDAHAVSPDLGPNCLQRLSVEVKVAASKENFICSKILYTYSALCHGWLVGFVALRPKSTAMVIAGRSIHLTTLFPGQA